MEKSYREFLIEDGHYSKEAAEFLAAKAKATKKAVRSVTSHPSDPLND